MLSDATLLELWRSVQGPRAELNGPLIRFAGKIQALLTEEAATRPAELFGDDTEPACAACEVEAASGSTHGRTHTCRPAGATRSEALEASKEQ